MNEILFQAFVYLTAAVVAVPIAKRLGLGSVLGYLIAGVIIGPVTGIVGSETQTLQHFAEFGVVMMLFLVGLELEPRQLWAMRNRLLGLGGLQVGVTAVLVTGLAMALGQPWRISIAIGLIFSLSSTAIVLQTLAEKGLGSTEGGRGSFSVLLFQDIAVIPMLALLPLLAMPAVQGDAHVDPPAVTATADGASTGEAGTTPAAEAAAAPGSADAARGDGHAKDDHHGGGGHGGLSLVDDLPSWAYALVVLAAIGFVIFGGGFLARPIFRFIAASRLREIFTAAALLLVIGIALLMGLVGLSPALGTFLAGVVLANSEFRHELESDIEPFKGLLLGLFFITVGAGIDFDVLFDSLGTILGLTALVIAIKASVLAGLARASKLPTRDALLFTLGLAQAGEFGFVLLAFAVQNDIVPVELSRTLSLVVALSMLLTPALFILADKLMARAAASGAEREADEITEKGVAIVAGLGRFGQIVNRIMRINGFQTVVLDHRADLIDVMRRFGVMSFYGDASRPDLLHAAGLHDAKVFVVAIDDKDRAVDMVEHARRECGEHIHIIARARDRHHVYALYSAGANLVVREVFESSVLAGKAALTALGMHRYEAEKRTRDFVRHDHESLDVLAKLWKPDVDVMDNTEYLATAKERFRALEEAMSGGRVELHDRTERGWSPPPRRYTRNLTLPEDE